MHLCVVNAVLWSGTRLPSEQHTRHSIVLSKHRSAAGYKHPSKRCLKIQSFANVITGIQDQYDFCLSSNACMQKMYNHRQPTQSAVAVKGQDFHLKETRQPENTHEPDHDQSMHKDMMRRGPPIVARNQDDCCLQRHQYESIICLAASDEAKLYLWAWQRLEPALR